MPPCCRGHSGCWVPQYIHVWLMCYLHRMTGITYACVDLVAFSFAVVFVDWARGYRASYSAAISIKVVGWQRWMHGCCDTRGGGSRGGWWVGGMVSPGSSSAAGRPACLASCSCPLRALLDFIVAGLCSQPSQTNTREELQVAVVCARVWQQQHLRQQSAFLVAASYSL